MARITLTGGKVFWVREQREYTDGNGTKYATFQVWLPKHQVLGELRFEVKEGQAPAYKLDAEQTAPPEVTEAWEVYRKGCYWMHKMVHTLAQGAYASTVEVYRGARVPHGKYVVNNRYTTMEGVKVDLRAYDAPYTSDNSNVYKGVPAHYTRPYLVGTKDAPHPETMQFLTVLAKLGATPEGDYLDKERKLTLLALADKLDELGDAKAGPVRAYAGRAFKDAE